MWVGGWGLEDEFGYLFSLLLLVSLKCFDLSVHKDVRL